jgi:uncharacterized membrane protein YqhA
MLAVNDSFPTEEHMAGGRLISVLLRLRWLASIVAFVSGIHAIAFVAIGVVRGYEGYRIIAQGPPWEGAHAPGIHIARSIDAFLIAMVFFVFAIGVTILFLVPSGAPVLQSVPEWMRVKSLSELKFLIWEAILVTLVVACVEAFMVSGRDLEWTALILPLALLVLSLALFLAKRASH